MSFFGDYSSFAGRSPSWTEPPGNWLPGITPIALLVARDAETAVTVSRMAVFPVGFEFDVTVSLRRQPADHGLMASMMQGPAAMQVAVTYAGGARGAFTADRPGERHGGVVQLFRRGGHGHATVFRATFWASPLPPPGPVEFTVAWPARDLTEASAAADGSLIIAAADQAVQLWPDEPDTLPEVDFSEVPLPAGGTSPADARAAEAAIRDAFVRLFDNGPERATDPLAAVQDGAAFAGVLEQIRARFPVEAATTRAVLGRVVFLDEVRAGVQFALVRTGSFSPGPQLGYAVRERGEWKVARDTYTRVIGMAGVPIPPPPPAV